MKRWYLAWGMPIYWLGLLIHRGLYGLGLLKSAHYSLPIISIGNLKTGGTGKSPMVHYLVEQLKPYIHLAVISRGYGRKELGIREVLPDSTALNLGDEPVALKQKFPDIAVWVSESRAEGVLHAKGSRPLLQTVLLDDAHQHLGLTPSHRILLTEYEDPFYTDYLLPAGDLREPREGAALADVVVVTKCPTSLPEAERQDIIKKIADYAPRAAVFFAAYTNALPYHFQQKSTLLQPDKAQSVILISAIARPHYLERWVKSNFKLTTSLEYQDHYNFSKSNLSYLADLWRAHPDSVILTTEKDLTRLLEHQAFLEQTKLPIYVVPVEVQMLDQPNEISFIEKVKTMLLDFKA